MTGGLIQLASKGPQDVFFTYNPQITFFKSVYKKHTNFSIQPMKQYFIYPPDFGKKVTCLLSKNGDLIHKIFLVLTLPRLKPYTYKSIPIQMAWVKNIAYTLIQSVEIEIGGKTIDKHYGEWMYLWSLLNENRDIGFLKMIGDIPDLFTFSEEKQEYTIHIPLQFWFCRHSGLSLPLLALQYQDVRIHVHFEEFEKCHLLHPTHKIELESELVNFQENEILFQEIDGKRHYLRFHSFDALSQTMYYSVLDTMTLQSQSMTTNMNQFDKILSSIYENPKYFIRSLQSNAFAVPKVNSVSTIFLNQKLKYISLKSSYLLVDYIFLEKEEKQKFLQTKLEYTLEQVTTLQEKTLEGGSKQIRFDLEHPCKYIVWVTQYSYMKHSLIQQFMNYTDLPFDHIQANSLLLYQSILMNGLEFCSLRDAKYFNFIQTYQHFLYTIPKGVNLYSFSLHPHLYEPSGSCNMSKIENLSLQLVFQPNVTITKDAKFRGYGVYYNVFQIVNGLSGLVFV